MVVGVDVMVAGVLTVTLVARGDLAASAYRAHERLCTNGPSEC